MDLFDYIDRAFTTFTNVVEKIYQYLKHFPTSKNKLIIWLKDYHDNNPKPHVESIDIVAQEKDRYTVVLFVYYTIIVFSTLVFTRLVLTFPVLAMGVKENFDPERDENIFFLNFIEFFNPNFLFAPQNIAILFFLGLRIIPFSIYLTHSNVDKLKKIWAGTLTWWAAIFTVVSAISIVWVG